MKSGEQSPVADFVLRVFTEFVGPLYSQEGVEQFKKFACASALGDRLRAGNLFLLAESGQTIIGVIEVHEHSHVGLLFVEKFFQRRGIARELLRRSIEICRRQNPGIRKITVNSSPNAVAAYQKIGFKTVEEEQLQNGMRFVPMELILDNNGGNRRVKSADAG
jgi:GNAT superfamily N-acetyltransferase